MLSLSHTTGYAILALSCLSRTLGQFVLAKDIAAWTGIPLPYLSKVLHALHGHGLIVGRRGYRGGFMLARPPEKVSLLEVAEAVEGKQWLPLCLLGLEKCDPQHGCPTHDFWTRERAKIEQELRRMRLIDVAGELACKSSALTADAQPSSRAAGGQEADHVSKAPPVRAEENRRAHEAEGVNRVRDTNMHTVGRRAVREMDAR